MLLCLVTDQLVVHICSIQDQAETFVVLMIKNLKESVSKKACVDKWI